MPGPGTGPRPGDWETLVCWMGSCAWNDRNRSTGTCCENGKGL